MARVLIALVLLTMLPGTAAACSLAGPVPGPGHFFLFEPATGDEIDIPVHQRSLGAGCELSNSFSFDGERFAWVESPENHGASTPDAVYLLDLKEDEAKRIRLTGIRHQVSLGTDFLLHISSDAAGKEKVWRYRFETGTEQEVPVTIVPGYRLLHGSQIAWRASDPGGGQRFNVFDAATSKYVLRDKTPADLHVPTDASLLAFDEQWLLFYGQEDNTDAWWSYRIATRETNKLEAHTPTWPLPSAITDGRAYGLETRKDATTMMLVSYDLEDGTAIEHGFVPHESPSRLVYVDGRVVLASYQVVDPHSHDPAATPPAKTGTVRTIDRPTESTPFSIPGPALPLLGLVLVGVACARRRRA